MRTYLCLLTLIALLVGCNKEIEPHQNVNEPDPDPETVLFTAADPADEWAVELIAGAGDWEPVTAEAVPANELNFGLCRIAIPGIDDHGPHNAYTLDELLGENRENKPKSPANQFIVNPIARGHFYATTADRDEAGTKPHAMPVGTVIIKEKYNRIEDAKKRVNPKAFGVMIKQEPGYNPEHGDWEYAYIEVDSSKQITSATRGKLANCIDCHGNRKQTDFVFRNYPLMQKPPR